MRPITALVSINTRTGALRRYERLNWVNRPRLTDKAELLELEGETNAHWIEQWRRQPRNPVFNEQPEPPRTVA